MVQHIVLWNFLPELSESQKKEACETIRKNLLAVKKEAKGVISLEVIVNELSSSNKDIGLISSFESEEALQAYQVHPLHVEAGKYIKTVTCDRVCLDYKA